MPDPVYRWERYTERARQVIALGQQACSDLGHAQITPAHLLVGIIDETQGLGAKALLAGGLDRERLCDVVSGLHSPPPHAPVGQIPFDPAASRALLSALDVSKACGADYVGTEHLLLSLARGAAEVEYVLQVLGVDADEVCRRLIPSMPQPKPAANDADRAIDRFSQELNAVLRRAAQFAASDGEVAIELAHLERALEAGAAPARVPARYWSPKAKKALEMALRTSLNRGSDEIGVEDLRRALERRQERDPPAEATKPRRLWRR